MQSRHCNQCRTRWQPYWPNEKSGQTLGLSKYTAEAAEHAANHPDKPGIAGKVKDVAGVHKTLWPEETAREQILQVDFLVNYSPPPGVEGHDPLKWERWRRRHPEKQVLEAPPPDPGKEKS
jgi:hypothetical protein